MTNFEELKVFGTGPYDIGITIEPMPHARLSRYNDDGYYDGITLLARMKGSFLSGVSSNSSKNNCYEVNVLTPDDVYGFDGDRIILASLEFHSLNMVSAHNRAIRFSGFFSGANAHYQKIYDSLVGFDKQEEFESLSELTNERGELKYLPPVWEASQKFIGWKANLTVAPYNPPQ